MKLTKLVLTKSVYNDLRKKGASLKLAVAGFIHALRSKWIVQEGKMERELSWI